LVLAHSHRREVLFVRYPTRGFDGNVPCS
jgi:hypothetical protein